MSVCVCTDVNVLTLVAKGLNGLYAVESELQYKVEKEDSDAVFSCEVSYYVPGAIRTAESRDVNITVHCEPQHHLTSFFFFFKQLQCVCAVHFLPKNNQRGKKKNKFKNVTQNSLHRLSSFQHE